MAKDTSKPVLKYKELISKSDKEILSEQLELDVQEAKSGLEVSISKTKLDIAKAKKRLIAAQSANPYDLQVEINAYQEVNELEEGLAYAETVLAERF